MAVTPATPPGRQDCQACLVDRCSTVSWLISSPSKWDRSGLHVMACRYPVVVQELCSLCFMSHFSQGPTVRHRTLVCPRAIAHVPIQTNRHSRPRLGVNMVRACASLVLRVGTNDDHTSNLGLKGTRVGFEPTWFPIHPRGGSRRRVDEPCTWQGTNERRKSRVPCFHLVECMCEVDVGVYRSQWDAFPTGVNGKLSVLLLPIFNLCFFVRGARQCFRPKAVREIPPPSCPHASFGWSGRNVSGTDREMQIPSVGDERRRTNFNKHYVYWLASLVCLAQAFLPENHEPSIHAIAFVPC